MQPDEIAGKLDLLLSLVNEDSQPNVNMLNVIVRNVSLISLNLKSSGYDLARRLAAALPVPQATAPRAVGLTCKASIQADLESDWAAHWCAQLQTPVVFHRKIWELCYVVQAVYENGHLRPGTRGLGFGCGVEPLPSYFASQGAAVTVTDLPTEEARARGWAATNQHAASLEQAWQPNLVARDAFDRLVDFRYVDMNDIPPELADYDFCWSICALEHLGSIERGLNFITNALRTLRAGGMAIHTTEFNINPDGPTIDNWPTVLFQRKHLEELADRLRAEGHDVATLDFNLGDGPLDRFIDLPPWSHDLPQQLGQWLGQPLHLKVGVDGFACTCFGIIVRKGG